MKDAIGYIIDSGMFGQILGYPYKRGSLWYVKFKDCFGEHSERDLSEVGFSCREFEEFYEKLDLWDTWSDSDMQFQFNQKKIAAIAYDAGLSAGFSRGGL